MWKKWQRIFHKKIQNVLKNVKNEILKSGIPIWLTKGSQFGIPFLTEKTKEKTFQLLRWGKVV